METDKIITGVVAGFVVFVLNQIATTTRNWWSHSDEARITKLQLAETFETYARSCADVASDIDEFVASSGAAGNQNRQIPTFPGFGDKTNWRSIGADLSEKLMTFSAIVRTEIEAIHDHHSQGFWDVAIADTSIRSLRLGLRACDMADELRPNRKYPEARKAAELLRQYLRDSIAEKEAADAAWKVKREAARAGELVTPGVP